MRNDLVSFENNFVQTKGAFWENEGDIVASITIDGYPEDDQAHRRAHHRVQRNDQRITIEPAAMPAFIDQERI